MNDHVTHKVVQGTNTTTWCGAASYNVAKQWRAVTCSACLDFCNQRYDRLRKVKTSPADPKDPVVLVKCRAYFGE